MTMNYCPICGTKATMREVGDEGEMPFCLECSMPLWDNFTTCVICAVVNEFNEVALIRQSYVSTTNYVCIAGHMKLGESAEDAAIREIEEEIGQKVIDLKFIHSYPYQKKDMLMLGFLARVNKTEFKISGEVDVVRWVPLDEAPALLREGGIAHRLVLTVGDMLRK